MKIPEHLERAYLVICREYLEEIPSVFGRLVWLSEHHASFSGSYIHSDGEHSVGSQEIDQALRLIQEIAFQEWLGYSLEEQMRHLKLFLSSLGPIEKIVEDFVRTKRYQKITPPQAIIADQKLFSSNIQILLYLLLSEFQLNLNSTHMHYRVAEVLHVMERHRSPWTLTLEAVSREVRLSGEYIRHLSKAATGVTFRAYLRCSRINRAAYLLRTTSLSIDEVATRLNYDYVSNFGRDFRALLDMSPTAYRLAHAHSTFLGSRDQNGNNR